MLVVIKSAPGTEEARRGMRLAKDMAADMAFIQNGVYAARKDRTEGLCGRTYALDEDIKLRAVEDLEQNVKVITCGELVDLMAEHDKVVGLF
jgi:sulfur relay protein TusB/DsrH